VGSVGAVNVVGLHALLMSGVRDFRELAGVARYESQVLASAAALDYVLMLTTQTANTPIPAAQAEQAIRDGIALVAAALADDNRRFALIALADDVSA
jgi:NADH:ubiquinone oxidoreductase subunit 6 (subunit J)